jgi:hypothetical protein
MGQIGRRWNVMILAILSLCLIVFSTLMFFLIGYYILFILVLGLFLIYVLGKLKAVYLTENELMTVDVFWRKKYCKTTDIYIIDAKLGLIEFIELKSGERIYFSLYSNLLNMYNPFCSYSERMKEISDYIDHVQMRFENIENQNKSWDK